MPPILEWYIFSNDTPIQANHRQTDRNMTGRVFFLLTCWLLITCGIANAGGSLTLWIHPYLPATELTERFAPLVEYLERELEQPVEVHIQRSYQTHVDMVGRDLADIAYVGPSSYIQITRQYGRKPLLVKIEVNGAPYFRGIIAVREEAPYTTLADLAGKSFAFGDFNSTMSHIVPRIMLMQSGIPTTKLAHHDFLGSHHDVALAVLGGYFEAGAVKQEVFETYRSRGLRMLATTPPIPNHLFLTRSNLPPELIIRIRNALLALNESPEKNKILTMMEDSATGLLPVSDQDYDEFRQLVTDQQP